MGEELGRELVDGSCRKRNLMKKATEIILDGMSQQGREAALHILRDHSINDDDPVIGLVALLRLRDSVFSEDMAKQRAEMQKMLDSHAKAMATLTASIDQAKGLPEQVRRSGEEIQVRTDGISAAAAQMSNVTGRVLVVLCAASGVGGGILTILAGKALHWL